MVMYKKLDRLRQWGKEKMDAEIKTGTGEGIKQLEAEMNLRHEGMEKLKGATKRFIHALSKRGVGVGKEKQLPIAHFGSTMVAHGNELDLDSEFGQHLSVFGHANERIGRIQDAFCANVTSSWLESTERSLLQMKQYQDARKTLDQRRLAFYTASRNMDRSKRDDFKAEEHVAFAKQKWEEASEDVHRRMLDIREAEDDSIADLSRLLDAELAYHDRCREVLMQVREGWSRDASSKHSKSAASSSSDLLLTTRYREDSSSGTIVSCTDSNVIDGQSSRTCVSTSQADSKMIVYTRGERWLSLQAEVEKKRARKGAYDTESNITSPSSISTSSYMAAHDGSRKAPLPPTFKVGRVPAHPPRFGTLSTSELVKLCS